MNLEKHFSSGVKNTVKLINGTNFSHKGPWVSVVNSTEIDRFHVGDFSSAVYTITAEFDTNKKETIQAIVCARPDQASICVFGKAGIDDAIISLNASVNNSWFSLVASPASGIFSGAKVTFRADYIETIIPLGTAIASSFTGGSSGGGTGGSSGSGYTGSGGTTYTLPTASTTVLGGVKVDGTTITISNGIISGSSTYSLPNASTAVIGGIKIDGTTLAFNGTGQLYATGAGIGGYILPTATSGTLGGVKVDGTSITIANGIISSAVTLTGAQVLTNKIIPFYYADQTTFPNASTYHGAIAHSHSDSRMYFAHSGTWNPLANLNDIAVLTATTTSTLGGVVIPAVATSGITNTAGTIGIATASTSQLGGVKVDGTTITISNGVITSAAASGLTSRTAVAVVTTSLASGASGTYSIVGFKGYALLSIQVSSAAWVTIYTDIASRTSDASRAETADPLPSAGVVAEVITAAAAVTTFSPATIGYSNESVPSVNIPIKVVNKSGSTQSITVTLTILKLEN